MSDFTTPRGRKEGADGESEEPLPVNESVLGDLTGVDFSHPPGMSDEDQENLASGRFSTDAPSELVDADSSDPIEPGKRRRIIVMIAAIVLAFILLGTVILMLVLNSAEPNPEAVRPDSTASTSATSTGTETTMPTLSLMDESADAFQLVPVSAGTFVATAAVESESMGEAGARNSYEVTYENDEGDSVQVFAGEWAAPSEAKAWVDSAKKAFDPTTLSDSGALPDGSYFWQFHGANGQTSIFWLNNGNALAFIGANPATQNLYIAFPL